MVLDLVSTGEVILGASSNGRLFSIFLARTLSQVRQMRGEYRRWLVEPRFFYFF